MKKNNLLKFFVKAVFACAILIAMAEAAFAQITLDLGVLTEDFPTKEEAMSESETNALEQNIPIPLKEPPQKIKKATPPVKPKPPAKPVVKKTASQKNSVQQSKEKYHVRESTPKSERKLKPQAAPVPQVKILATNDTSPETENPTPEENKKEVAQEPKLSKHFLEQQRLTKAPEQTPEKASAIEASVAKQTPKNVETVLPPPVRKSVQQLAEDSRQAAQSAAKTNVREKEAEVAEKAKKEIKTDIKDIVADFSVFPVSEKLTPEERSAALAREIPQDSATIKALSDKKTLSHIFLFKKKSAELTEEMQDVLNTLAASLKKDKGRRLILYSYGAADPAEPGKERQYALRRALMIRSYLTTQGIRSLRIELRSQGARGAGDKIPDRTDIIIQDK